MTQQREARPASGPRRGVTGHLDGRRKPALLDEGIVQSHHQVCVPSLKEPVYLLGNYIRSILHSSNQPTKACSEQVLTSQIYSLWPVIVMTVS